MKSLAERAVLGSAIEEACALLPDGWSIEIRLEHDSGYADLSDCEGNTHEYPSNHEHLADSIRDAIEYARNWEEPPPDDSLGHISQ